MGKSIDGYALSNWVDNVIERLNLVEGSTVEKQFIKLTEELGEVAEAISKGKEEEILSELGDMLFVIQVLATQKGSTPEECLYLAYDKVKDRKGRMVNGVFIKEEDL